jgi:single-stranded-DNA-specific exonuclease
MQVTVKSQIDPSASADDIFQQILSDREYKTIAKQEVFLHPPRPTLKSLLSETGLKSSTLSKFKKLLDKHLAAGDDICVFGDYDADGITATAIMWQALIYYAKGRTSRILPFLPDRLRHGYGLSVKAIDEIVGGDGFKSTRFPDFAPKLVITVDNGIVAHPAVALLKDQGIDVIVTDHHTVADTLPAADLIVHTTATSGAGIAWIVALSVLNESDFSYDLIDLATIGVVADMMPLIGMNRGIVVHGLAALAVTKRAGLLALYQSATIATRAITTYDINYVIAPRINAAGRLYDPYDALRLLCATSLATAGPLAHKIDAHNHDRQELTDRAIEQAGKVSFDHKIIVVSGEYHEGIIGLVAGKLTERFHKPSIVMSVRKDLIKASARSVTGVNITELLRSLPTQFLSLGGHSAAAGFSLPVDTLNFFLEDLYSVADSSIPDELLEAKLVADLPLSPSQVTLTLAKLLSTMEPFGVGNPKPKFLFHDLLVLEDRELGRDGKHHKLMIESGSKTLEVLMFNTQHHHPINHISSLIASIDVNVWHDRETVQLIASYVE